MNYCSIAVFACVLALALCDGPTVSNCSKFSFRAHLWKTHSPIMLSSCRQWPSKVRHFQDNRHSISRCLAWKFHSLLHCGYLNGHWSDVRHNQVDQREAPSNWKLVGGSVWCYQHWHNLVRSDGLSRLCINAKRYFNLAAMSRRCAMCCPQSAAKTPAWERTADASCMV